MPQVASTSVGSIRQKDDRYELLSPDGQAMFSGTSPGEAREFAASLQMPVREGIAPAPGGQTDIISRVPSSPESPAPAPGPSAVPTLPGAGLSVFGVPGAPPGAAQPSVGAPMAPDSRMLQRPSGVSPAVEAEAIHAQLPKPADFTKLLNRVVDVKLGKRPFVIGIPDEDLEMLSPAGIRAELSRRTDELLRQGGDVQSIMAKSGAQFAAEMERITKPMDKYYLDLQNRQDMFRSVAFTEPFLIRGVMPDSLKSVLSPEEQVMWQELSAFQKEQFAKGKVPQPYAHKFNEDTGETIVLYRDPVSGEVTQKIIKGAAPKPVISRRVSTGAGRGIAPAGAPAAPPTPPAQTWEAFLAEEQERRGMTIDPRSSLYRELQQQFAGAPGERLDDASERQIARYSFPVQQVLRGKMEVRDLLVGGTAAERARYSDELNNARAKGLVPEGSEFTTRQQQDINKFRSDFRSDPSYKDILDIETGWQGVQVGLKQGDGFGDIAAINAFQRMIDPGATVREGDVALLQQASALKDRWLSDYPIKKLQKGDKLPAAVRTRMRNTARQLFEVRSRNFNEDVATIFENQAKVSGVPFNLIGRRFGVKEKSSRVDFGSYYE